MIKNEFDINQRFGFLNDLTTMVVSGKKIRGIIFLAVNKKLK